MKVILYMAVSANGMIAKENDVVDFVSHHSWKTYKAMIKKSGNIIVGRHTYKIMEKEGDLSGLKNIIVVIVSRDFSFNADSEGVFVARAPKGALLLLEKKGFKSALVVGGGKTNASFLSENLVGEIFLGIEPSVFGKGIRIFAEQDFEAKLKLLGTKKLSRNEIQLHYKILK